MTQLSGAHAFRRFLRQLTTDFHEILVRLSRIAKVRPFDMTVVN